MRNSPWRQVHIRASASLPALAQTLPRFRAERVAALDELGAAKTVDDLLGNCASIKPAAATNGTRGDEKSMDSYVSKQMQKKG